MLQLSQFVLVVVVDIANYFITRVQRWFVSLINFSRRLSARGDLLCNCIAARFCPLCLFYKQHLTRGNPRHRYMGLSIGGDRGYYTLQGIDRTSDRSIGD